MKYKLLIFFISGLAFLSAMHNLQSLAQAVQIIGYELRVAAMGGAGLSVPPSDWEPVDASQMEGFFQHLEQTLLDIRFLNPRQPKKLMMRLRRLFNRARPDQNEINILRGILKASQEASEKSGTRS